MLVHHVWDNEAGSNMTCCVLWYHVITVIFIQMLTNFNVCLISKIKRYTIHWNKKSYNDNIFRCPYGLWWRLRCWSKVMHCVGNRVPFGKQTWSAAVLGWGDGQALALGQSLHVFSFRPHLGHSPVFICHYGQKCQSWNGFLSSSSLRTEVPFIS